MGLKQKINNKETTIGSWITLGHPSVAEIMAGAGFDWLTVDMEHSSITMGDALRMVQAIDLTGIPALIRVGDNDPNLIKRAMDTGAHGVIVPMVNSREESERAVASVKYPPRGIRGVGLARAQKYGMGFEEYKRFNEEESVVIVQIEHIKAVENMKEILSVDGVDAFLIGPYDLSGSLGVPGQFDHPDVIEALEIVKKVAREMDVVSGFHVIQPAFEEVLKKADEGYKFIAYSLDTLFIATHCRAGLKSIKDGLK